MSDKTARDVENSISAARVSAGAAILIGASVIVGAILTWIFIS